MSTLVPGQKPTRWFVSYLVGTLPEGLPVLEGVKVQAAHPPWRRSSRRRIPLRSCRRRRLPPASALLILPTPTPAPHRAAADVVASAANLRAGPGILPPLSAAPTGESLSLAGQTDGGEWFQFDGGAWIAGFC